jgi:hypothetical protein
MRIPYRQYIKSGFDSFLLYPSHVTTHSAKAQTTGTKPGPQALLLHRSEPFRLQECLNSGHNGLDAEINQVLCYIRLVRQQGEFLYKHISLSNGKQFQAVGFVTMVTRTENKMEEYSSNNFN